LGRGRAGGPGTQRHSGAGDLSRSRREQFHHKPQALNVPGTGKKHIPHGAWGEKEYPIVTFIKSSEDGRFHFRGDNHLQRGSRGSNMRKMTSLGLLSCLFLFGCGDGLSGVYVNQDQDQVSAIEKIELKSGKAFVTTLAGPTVGGDYSVSGDKITIAAPSGSLVLTSDGKGCLDGGDMLGKFCKKA
jgi:hypothetical protein